MKKPCKRKTSLFLLPFLFLILTQRALFAAEPAKTPEGADNGQTAQTEQVLSRLDHEWREIQKQAFQSGGVADWREQKNTETALVPKPVSPAKEGRYVISMGTVLPALLLTGLNSDLPGFLLAQVSEHVYDTETGKHILIPQGSRLFGEYDSKIVYGQKRPLVRWMHLIYPDGSTLNLEGMAGVDKEGYSGFRANVNSHFGPLLMSAVMVSVFSAAAEIADDEKDGLNITLSQPTITLSDAVPVGMVMLRIGNKVPDGWKVLDGSKILASEVSSEFLSLAGSMKNYPKLEAPEGMIYCVKVQSVKPTLLGSLAASGFTSTSTRIRDESGRYFGAEFAEALANMAEQFFTKQLDRAPTLVVKQGYRFHVMVNRTVYLPEWKG